MVLPGNLLPFFLTVSLEFFCSRSSFPPNSFLTVSNNLVFYIGLPVVLFVSIAIQPDGTPVILPTVAVCIAIPFTDLPTVPISGLLFGKKQFAGRTTWIQCFFHANQELGLPVLLCLCGERGLIAAASMFAPFIGWQNILSSPVYQYVTQGSAHPRKKSIIGIRRNQAVSATTLRLVWHGLKIPLPTFLQDTFRILPGLFLPPALFTTGPSDSLKTGCRQKQGMATLFLLIHNYWIFFNLFVSLWLHTGTPRTGIAGSYVLPCFTHSTYFQNFCGQAVRPQTGCRQYQSQSYSVSVNLCILNTSWFTELFI